MIITKSWLNEWVDLSDKSVNDICTTLNQIGLEVDSTKTHKTLDGIIVGFVLSCEPHPDAKKLNVCQVDVGTGVRQIVCGASNVREGIYVCVAMIGTIMPDGLEIKPVKLRGVESDGMMCSTSEINLVSLCDGILILDDSIGELKAGRLLSEFDSLNDDVIEIELTANRGDCLSHQGVARDLAAAFGKTLKKHELKDSDYRRTGSSRVIHLEHGNDIDADVIYKAFEYSEFEIPLKYRYRLNLLDETYATDLEGMLLYSTLATGVVLRTYNHKAFTDKGEEAIASIKLFENDKGLAIVGGLKDVSTIGITQADSSKVKKTGEKVILEASYIHPETISKQVYDLNLKSDDTYYRTSRGSEPDINLGITYCSDLLMEHCGIEIFPGTFEYRGEYTKPTLNLNMNSINALIGDDIEKAVMVKVLTILGFEISKSQSDSFVVHPPRFRHDIKNEQDVVEEIVRMVGIDNIKSKPLEFIESDAYNDAYRAHQLKRTLRQQAAAVGFFETLSYLFSERKTVEALGFKATFKKDELLNPIVDSMDTMRPTMHIAHIEAASRNIKMGQKSVPLFEYGTIFDTKREETTVLSFLYSGDMESAKVSNHGQPDVINFELFVQKISDVVGQFELTSCEAENALMHPYQSASIVVDGEVIGKVFKLHTKVMNDYDLPDTFLAEIDVSCLEDIRIQAKSYSKYQAVRRDISIVVPNTFVYEEIKTLLSKLDIPELNSFDMIDIYSVEELGEDVSLTLRFIIQSDEKTLKDKEIARIMKTIMDTLKDDLGFTLR
jgi:phenylalanyl-tRNA synthetase beta chain